MDIQQLLYWKENKLTLSQISRLTGINLYTIRSRYVAANIEFYKKPVMWNLDCILDSRDIDGQYVIGLLAADGYINKRTIDIFIQERDIELLYRILLVLDNTEAAIHTKINSNYSKQVGLHIGSIYLIDYLSSYYGFFPKKSRSLPFPRHLENPLPYLRGFFDGDGYMGNTCTFTIGSLDFAHGLLDWVYKIYSFQPNVQMVGMNKDVFNIHFRKKHIDFIKDLFSYPGLERKYLKFLEYLPN